MDRLPPRSHGWSLLALAAALLPGCVATDSVLVPGFADKAPAPCQVTVAWQNQVIFTPDPANGGRPIPGLAGRLYIFDKNVGTPLAADGALVIDLVGLLPERADNQPVHLERWCIDKETLKRLEKRDILGIGYTLFLPWAGYRPTITQVQLKTQYTPVKGAPLYDLSTPLRLTTEGTPAPVVRERTELGQGTVLPPTATMMPHTAAAPPAMPPTAPIPPAGMSPAAAPVAPPMSPAMAHPGMPAAAPVASPMSAAPAWGTMPPAVPPMPTAPAAVPAASWAPPPAAPVAPINPAAQPFTPIPVPMAPTPPTQGTVVPQPSGARVIYHPSTPVVPASGAPATPAMMPPPSTGTGRNR